MDCVVNQSGTLAEPIPPWEHARSDGCQLDMVYPGLDEDYGKAMQKGQVWTANFDIIRMGIVVSERKCFMGQFS